MPQEFTNFASTTLEQTLNVGDNTFKVASGTGSLFPVLVEDDNSSFSYITVEDESGNVEIIKATYRNGDNFLVADDGRGQEGTTEQSFVAGSRVELRLTAATLNQFTQRDGDNIDGTVTIIVSDHISEGELNPDPSVPGVIQANTDTVQPKLYLIAEDGSQKVMAEPLYVFESGTNPPANVGHGSLGLELPAYDLKVFDSAANSWRQASFSQLGGTLGGHLTVRVEGVTYFRTTDNADGNNTKGALFDESVGIAKNLFVTGESTFEKKITVKGDSEFNVHITANAGILTKDRILRVNEDGGSAGAHLFWDTPTAEAGGRIFTTETPPDPADVDLNIGDIWMGF